MCRHAGGESQIYSFGFDPAASRYRELLLVGNRQNHVYAAAELEYLQASSEELIALIDPKLSSK
jgi:hypothetical protein